MATLLTYKSTTHNITISDSYLGSSVNYGVDFSSYTSASSFTTGYAKNQYATATDVFNRCKIDYPNATQPTETDNYTPQTYPTNATDTTIQGVQYSLTSSGFSLSIDSTLSFYYSGALEKYTFDKLIEIVSIIISNCNSLIHTNNKCNLTSTNSIYSTNVTHPHIDINISISKKDYWGFSNNWSIYPEDGFTRNCEALISIANWCYDAMMNSYCNKIQTTCCIESLCNPNDYILI